MENSDRIQRWVTASHKFSSPQYCIVDIQTLGQTELILFDLEKQAKLLQQRQQASNFNFNLENNPHLMSQLTGFSKYWMFGFYEVLRNFREANAPLKQKKEFPKSHQCLSDLFQKIEITRMPLAKYEVAKVKDSTHWPEILFFPEQGCCGWKVYSKNDNQMKIISRIQIADEFLNASEKILLERSYK